MLGIRLKFCIFFIPIQAVCLCDIYFSRIRRNLSIHIARFSASESPRAIYQHSQNSPIVPIEYLPAE